jgi:hypothetical protein
MSTQCSTTSHSWHNHKYSLLKQYGFHQLEYSQQRAFSNVNMPNSAHNNRPQNASDHNNHAQINPKSSSTCPYCKMIKQDWDHALKCVHSTNIMWYLCFMMASLQKRCNKVKAHHRNSNWQHLTLVWWLTPFKWKLPTPTTETNIHCSIANQWKGLQNQHLEWNGIEESMLTSQSWSILTILLLWTYFF